MAIKKKTEIEETTSTTKKGITKVNTTRTKKIVEKAKTPTKRTTSPKAKDSAEKETAKSKTTKAATAKKTATKKATSKTGAEKAEKKTTAKKANTKTTTKKASAKSADKAIVDEKIATTEAKSTPVKKVATKKSATKSTAKKASTKTVAKSTAQKATTKKATSSTTKKSATKSTAKKATTTRKPRTKKLADNNKITASTVLVQEFAESEYYDLPYTYNQTVVKILAQTPDILFVYWDISNEDRQKFIETYGENFFNNTKPVLIITNTTMGYKFEVDINDFANSWYLQIQDAKCEYHIELGRRPISHEISIPDNYIYVASSNVIEIPNDHILFEKEQDMVYFKNVKTNVVSAKPITSLPFISNMGKIYNVYDVYKKIYKDESIADTSKIMGNSSSVFK